MPRYLGGDMYGCMEFLRVHPGYIGRVYPKELHHVIGDGLGLNERKTFANP